MQRLNLYSFSYFVYLKKKLLENDALMEKRKKLEEIQENLSVFLSSITGRIKRTLSELHLPPTMEILESIITLESPRKKSRNCRKDRWYHPRDCSCCHCKSNFHHHHYEKQQRRIYEEEFEHFKDIQSRKYLARCEKRNCSCIDRRDVTCCFDDRPDNPKNKCHTFQDISCCKYNIF